MRRRPRQRGVAVVTALLLTTLAVTIVTSLFWQQQVQVRSMENQRLQLQTRWILRGALDWARLVLRQDAIDNPMVTALDHVWNTPLEETRLDQYIERERVEGENFDATLSGRIIDASSRYNLQNLAKARQVNPAQLLVFKRLLENLRLDPMLAERAAQAVAASQEPVAAPGQDPGPGPDPALGITAVEDLLAVEGFTPQALEQLREFVIVLPVQNKVNVNTAPPEVLAAVVGFSVAEGGALAAMRKTAHFRDAANFKSALNGRTVDDSTFDVKSEYFLIESRVRLDRAALNAQALVHRPVSQPQATLVWIRQN